MHVRSRGVYVSRWASLFGIGAVACSAFGASGSEPSPGSDGGVDPSVGDAAVADGRGATGAGACPVGDGPAMRVVAIDGDNARVCVDLTEVTTRQYGAFRARVNDALMASLVDAVPTGCAKLGLAALAGAALPSDLPQVSVSFCSAAFYCAAQGKRLCGGLDGAGIIRDATSPDAPLEWEAACANGLSTDHFPWGVTDPTSAAVAKCWNQSTSPGATGPRAVGTVTSCGPAGGAGPYDMIGNVWEWVNVRQDATSASYTGVRGGAFDGPSVGNGCGTTHAVDANVGEYAAGRPTVGFRCCASP